MKVPFLDLTIQYSCIKKEIQELLDKVINSQQFILGPEVSNLEIAIARYCNTDFAIGVSSGTDALLLSMMALDIGQNDRVITTPYTFFSTVGSICRLGATPVFVDIERSTYNINPEKLAEVLYTLTDEERRHIRAIVPVHLYGQCANMEPIMDIAKKFYLKVIEDAAQAIGASCSVKGTIKKACGIGDFGCLSFFPSKNLGGFGDGGMVTTSNVKMAEKIRSLRVHGQVGNYHHHFIGINGRLDAIQAAVLLVKFRYLEKWTEQRRQNADYYKTLFRQSGLCEQITLPSVQNGSRHVFNQFVIRAPWRDKLKNYLAMQGIGCSIYYPVPLHLQKCFSYLGYRTGDFPEAEKASRESLALPIFPEITKEQQEYVVEQIKDFYSG